MSERPRITKTWTERIRRQTKNAASEGTSASHCSQARCECRDPRTVWNGTRNQWICDDCGKPANSAMRINEAAQAGKGANE